MLTKPGVHSWEEGTPDNHLCVSKAQYPFLGGMDSLSILTATAGTAVGPVGAAHPAFS